MLLSCLFQGYCIIIVWSCYKYLVHGEVSSAVQTVNLERSSSGYERQEQTEGLSQVMNLVNSALIFVHFPVIQSLINSVIQYA